MGNSRNKHESLSKTGYGVGFASKQQRFATSQGGWMGASVMTGSAMSDLIYARASASPGPGHYEPATSSKDGSPVQKKKGTKQYTFHKNGLLIPKDKFLPIHSQPDIFPSKTPKHEK